METKESMQTWIKKILIEKLALVIIVAAAGFGFNYVLQMQKTQGEYQKQIFDRRVQTYVSLLEEAKLARDQLAILYGVSGENQDSVGDLSRRAQIETLREDVQGILSGVSRSSHDSYPYLSILESLSKIEQITRENDLYISQDVKKEVGLFLDIVVSDLNSSFEKTKAEMREKGYTRLVSEPNPAAWKRADEAYLKLLQVIRSKLQIDGIPLG